MTHPGDGGAPLIRTNVRYRVLHTLDWTDWDTGATPVTRATITGLQRTTRYEVQVQVTNAIGTSPWVDGISLFRTLANTEPPPPPPPPPQDAELAQVMGVEVAPGDAHLVVTWTAVDTATGYTVQWKSGGQGCDTGDRQATVTPGSTTRHTIDDLANGTAYTVRVIATGTGATAGPPSAEVTGTPTRDDPPEPVPALPLAGAIGLGLLLLLLGAGGRALRGRASG